MLIICAALTVLDFWFEIAINFYPNNILATSSIFATS
ncbi:hypothetical protein SAMN05443667_102145 [Flavobacterium gillisiae]|uniref:Uncharacterized protein n=1 Tax=Flavobacterium gillisiae TaxID=150146 RepID=A0A1H3YWR5_9FLAO|nr:hypothetical protein SAMN05443667_102145 [Flavobacterium gillisiae]